MRMEFKQGQLTIFSDLLLLVIFAYFIYNSSAYKIKHTKSNIYHDKKHRLTQYRRARYNIFNLRVANHRDTTCVSRRSCEQYFIGNVRASKNS